MKIVTVEEMRRIEQECARFGLPADRLMENAGRAVAEETRRILGAIDGKQLLILIGPGNNGGDGLVAARYLHEWGARVTLFLSTPRARDDINLKLVREHPIALIDGTRENSPGHLEHALETADAVIDALFGTGKSRPLTGIFTGALERVAEAKKQRPALRIIALDLPSGLNADTGAVDPATPLADYTITLGLLKPGLFTFPGAERVGRLSVVDIGIPPELSASINLELISDEWARAVLPLRPAHANKGTFGKVLVIAGSINYIGAAYLACTGAIRVGAGLVTLATPRTLLPILASKLNEVTYLPMPESEPGAISGVETIDAELSRFDVLLIGCGLGQSEPTREFVRSLLLKGRALPRLVIDADAINILAGTPGWERQLPADAVLTPHPGEMGRLGGLTVSAIQADRIVLSRKAAAEWHKTVVLKGAYTVIAEPDGRCRISPVAHAGLASAGTGDVLAGAIAGLLAQGLSLFDAASLGVYLHGKAAGLVKARLGDAGMVASDLLPELPLTIKRLKEG